MLVNCLDSSVVSSSFSVRICKYLEIFCKDWMPQPRGSQSLSCDSPRFSGNQIATVQLQEPCSRLWRHWSKGGFIPPLFRSWFILKNADDATS